MSKPRILHCFGDPLDFVAERLPQRLALLGKNLSHELAGISLEHWRAVQTDKSSPQPVLLADFPSLAGKPAPGRLIKIANAIKPYDLVLSYGWGAIDAALAHTLFGEALGLPPLIHHETTLTGERKRLSKRRTWYRRVALGKAAGLVVPGERLEEVALVNWQQPLGRVKRIAPGVAVPLARSATKPDALTGVIKREGEFWIGAWVAEQGEIATYLPLIAALSKLPDAWHVVIMAEGIDTDPLSAAAEASESAHRLHIAKPADDLAGVIDLFDIWAALTDTPDAQRSALAAMAGGRPVLAAKGSEVGGLLPPENQRHCAAAHSPEVLKQSLRALAEDEEARKAIQKANAAFARKHYSVDQTLDRYRRLYASAMGIEIKA